MIPHPPFPEFVYAYSKKTYNEFSQSGKSIKSKARKKCEEGSFSEDFSEESTEMWRTSLWFHLTKTVR